MTRVRCFAPIADSDARILILGSMPGEASLAAGQYYAHPRNQFWPIVGELFGFDASASYEARVAALKTSRIAVWDVLQSCVRHGSLDASIQADDLAVNDFADFFVRHGGIRRVYFNGAKAEQCYKRYVLPGFAVEQLAYARLPSTSPAHAGLSLERKLEVWREALEG